MPSPAVANEPLVPKPPEKHLSDALLETFQTLDIGHVTPDVIIKRFSKSGGIDRVRIAVERRMKEYQEAHKRHTVAASEQFLNQALPDHTGGPPPAKLMQQAQDFVLATVKDRIERDVDSVTEQGKARWFFECVRDEIVSACKEHDPTMETDNEPAPSTNVVDGAKAILKNLTRSVARARQVDHALDPARVVSNKEQHANGHADPATNGKVGDDLKKRPTADENHPRGGPVGVGLREVKGVEGTADNHRKKNVVPPRSPEVKAAPRPPRKSQQDGPLSVHTSLVNTAGQVPSASVAKTETNGETNPMPSEQQEKDYDALADDLLLGDNVGGVVLRHESEAVTKSVLPSSSGADNTSDKKTRGQTEKTEAPHKENLANQAQASVIPPQAREINREVAITDADVGRNDSEENLKKPLSKASTPESKEVSPMEVDEQAAVVERPSMGKERSSAKEQPVQRNRVTEEKPLAATESSIELRPSAEQELPIEQSASLEQKAASGQKPSSARKLSEEQERSEEQKPSAEPKLSEKQTSFSEQRPYSEQKSFSEQEPCSELKPFAHQEPSKERKPSAKQESSTEPETEEAKTCVLDAQAALENARMAIEEAQIGATETTISIPHIHEDEQKLDEDVIRERATRESKDAPEVSHEHNEVVNGVRKVEQESSPRKRKKGESDDKCNSVDGTDAKGEPTKSEHERNGAVEESKDVASDMEITTGNTDENEVSPPPFKGHTRDTSRHRSKQNHKSSRSHVYMDAEEIPAASKHERNQEVKSGKEGILNSARNEKGSKVKKNEASKQSDSDRHLKSEPTSPPRRISRRRSSRMMPEEETGASGLAKTMKDTKTQMTAVTKKEKRPRGRSKRKTSDSVAGRSDGKRKAAKNDATKQRSEVNEKKRRRSQAADHEESSASQPTDAPPDPDKENWPRGYGIERCCVPEDYDSQQNVLHALTMLLERAYAAPFSEPVDPSIKGLEMYASVVKNPMDLGEICKRLRNSSAERGYYLTVSEILQDVELVWWNCRRYNGRFDPIINDCERSQLQLSFLLEQHGIQTEKTEQKRRRVSRVSAPPAQNPEEDAALGDNDGRLVGKKILIFTELKKKKKKEWFAVQVKAYDSKSKSYTLLWVDERKTTKKATFGIDKMYPVYRT